MNQLLIVIATEAASLEDFLKKPIAQSLKHHTAGNEVDYHLVTSNKEGLSTVYNRFLKDPANIDKTILFVHDDVELNDILLAPKLLSSPFSVTGVAGATSFNKTVDKLAWHLATKREDMVGEAAHTQNGRIWTSVFGPTPSRALIIDGLFVSCKVKDLVEKDCYFDEEFDFHHYDMAFCLKANEKKVTVGVMPIYLVHHGLGDSMLTPEWEASNVKFKAKFSK